MIYLHPLQTLNFHHGLFPLLPPFLHALLPTCLRRERLKIHFGSPMEPFGRSSLNFIMGDLISPPPRSRICISPLFFSLPLFLRGPQRPIPCAFKPRNIVLEVCLANLTNTHVRQAELHRICQYLQNFGCPCMPAYSSHKGSTSRGKKS